MISKEVSDYMAKIGRSGGRKSRRKLDSDKARSMVRIREARKAYRAFHEICFWSSPKELHITEADIPWIAEQLRKNGGSKGWEIARKLCP